MSNERTRKAVKHYTDSLGLGLVNLNGKRPVDGAWQNNPITKPQGWTGGNIGLNHLYSNTCTLDVDHVSAEYALSLAGVNLKKLLDAAPYKMIGSPDNPPKPIFRIPPGVELRLKQFRWPDPEGHKNKNGKVKMVTIFELRGGTGGAQDVLPPSIHPDTQRPYQWLDNKVPMAIEDIPFLPKEMLNLWQNWGEYETILKDNCPWAAEKPKTPDKPKPPTQPARPVDPDFDVSIVQRKFNEQYRAGEILERNGYTPKGQNKWLCPSSSTGNPGVIGLDSGKVWSHHGSDELADGFPHDAYDVFTILEHNGDKSAAWKAGRELLGIELRRGAVDIALTNGNARRQDKPAPKPLTPLIPLPPDIDLAYHENVHDHLGYIRQHWGLVPETIAEFKVGYCAACPTSTYSASFTTPYYRNDNLIDIRHRLLSPNGNGTYRPEIEGQRPHLFNTEAVTGDDWAILVKQEFQTMLLHQNFLPAIGLPSVFRREWLDELSGLKRVFIALEPGFDSIARKIGALLSQSGIEARISSLPFSPSDMLVKYDCGIGDFCKFIDQSWVV